MRGCQRQIIMLKGTDSQIFDEAYFLLRKDFDRSRGDEGELVREAERLVALNTTRRRVRVVSKWALFAAGMLAGHLLRLSAGLVGGLMGDACTL